MTYSYNYKLTNGLVEVLDLCTYFTTDILGTKRPLGAAWDIGALEH